MQRRLRDRKIERQRRVEAQMPSTITVSLLLLLGNAIMVFRIVRIEGIEGTAKPLIGLLTLLGLLTVYF